MRIRAEPGSSGTSRPGHEASFQHLRRENGSPSSAYRQISSQTAERAIEEVIAMPDADRICVQFGEAEIKAIDGLVAGAGDGF